MKHLHLFVWLCLSLFYYSSLPAQMFGGTNAKWIYEISNFSTSGYFETDLIGTTLLNNQAVQTYRTTVHEYSLVTRDTNIYRRPNEFMYQENGVLYYYNSTNMDFDTLIWFDGVPGDVWEIESPLDSSEVFTTEIIDTGSLIINSNPLRFLAVHYNGGIPDTLVEDIGSISSSIKPWEKLTSEAPAFRCYSDDNLGLYQKDPNVDCSDLKIPVEELLFGGPNAKWTFDRQLFDYIGYLEVTPEKDTIIDGILCQKYQKTVAEKDRSLNFRSYSLEPDFLREEDEVLYYYNQGAGRFDTLIWFGAEINDTWHIMPPSSDTLNITNDTIYYTVVDIGQILIDGVSKRFQAVEIQRPDMVFQDTLVVGIGSINYYYKPWQSLFVVTETFPEGEGFRCFQNDTILFQKDADIYCDYIPDFTLFGGPGAVWTYTRYEYTAPGYVTNTFIGDTLLDGRNASILSKTSTIRYDDGLQTFPLSPDYIYNDQENNVVYIFDTGSQTFDTLFFWSASRGTSWNLNGPDEEMYTYQVTDTREEKINGLRRWLMTVDILRNGEAYYSDTIYLGIGPIVHSYKPWDYGIAALDGPADANELRCYQDTVLGLYQRNPELACDFIPPAPTLFGGPNAQWTFSQFSMNSGGFTVVSVAGDTIIGGKNCQIYSKINTKYIYMGGDIVTEELSPDFMYEENEVLYIYNKDLLEFDTLLWFGGNIGDTWEIISPFEYLDTNSFEITDAGKITINDVELDFYEVRIGSRLFAGEFYTDTIIEGIGTYHNFYKPWQIFITAVDGPHEGYSFRCYSDDNLGLYKKDPTIACGFFGAPSPTFGGPNARWTYDRFSFSSRGYTEISISGDTVINGQNCQIYSKINTEKNCSLNVVQINELPPDYMYEEDDVLYFYNPDLEIFDTLLWFGASLIDSWEIISPEDESFDTLLYRVTDTGQLIINDIIHPFLEVEISSARFRDNFTYRDTIVPGIGTLTHFYKPWQIFATQVDGAHDGYSFRCYEDDQIGFFQKDSDIPCDFIHDSAPYGGPGAIWTYNRNLGQIQGYLEVTNIGDTTINDFHLHILQKTVVMQLDQNRQYDTLAPTYIHIDHEGSDVIYYFDTSDQSIDTLIWYGANVGDTWELNGPREFSNRYEVIGTGEIDIEGYTRTYQAVNIYTNDVLSYQDTIVYGIGTISYSFLPWDFLFSTLFAPFDAQEFRCYRDDIIGLYQKDPDVDCDLLVNSKQYRPNWEVGFYPNPVHQTLYIDIPESVGEVQYMITSPTGSILEQGTFREAPTIDMGRYPTGLYHVRLVSKDKVGILKVIKSD